MKAVILTVSLCALLCACGPKEIGQGYADDYGEPPDASAADQMRLPMTGASNTQRMLYYYNRPEIMQQMRSMQLSRYNRMLGISPEDPAYRSVPEQRSPFRQ